MRALGVTAVLLLATSTVLAQRPTVEILAEYRQRREKFIGDGKPGIVALLRDWYCTADVCAIPMAPK
jgi:hypothetical protein